MKWRQKGHGQRCSTDLQRKNWQTRFREGFKVYKTAINTPPLGFWVIDGQGHFLEVNDAYLKQSGYGRGELLDMTIADVEALETPEETAGHIRSVVVEGYGRFRTEHRRKDGSTWPVEVVATYSKLRGGRLFVYIEDITEKVDQEERLALASRVFETMEQAVVVTDTANRIVSINPAAARIGGYTLEEVLGKDPRMFASGRHDSSFYAAMWEDLNTTGHWEGEIWDRRKNGEVYAKWLTIYTICDAQGTLKQYFSVFTDITKRKKTEDLIWKQANFDALTGLPNRQLMLERLEQELKKGQRSSHPLALLFIDLDRFKEVNDSLGHAKGDMLLVQAGAGSLPMSGKPTPWRVWGGTNSPFCSPISAARPAWNGLRRPSFMTWPNPSIWATTMWPMSRPVSGSPVIPMTPATRPDFSTMPIRQCTWRRPRAATASVTSPPRCSGRRNRNWRSATIALALAQG